MISSLKSALLVVGLAASLFSAAPTLVRAQDRIVAIVFPDARLSIRVSDGLEAKLGKDARLTTVDVISVRIPKAVQHDFADATMRNVGNKMQLMVGCNVVLDAVIREPILGGTFQLTIDGDLATKVELINAGAAPCDQK